jgi:hypothetical protein
MEEGVARVSHQLRNHLAAVRNATFYLSRRFKQSDVWQSDPRVPSFLSMIEEQLQAASHTLARGVASQRLRARATAEVELEPQISEAVQRFRADFPEAPVAARVEPGTALVDAEELVVASYRLLQAVAAQTEGELSLAAGPEGDSYAIRVSGPARSAKPPERAGVELAWAVARRVAVLHSAEFSRSEEAGRVQGALVFSNEEPAADDGVA